ncbi:predicted protein [Arabidopsis lyrata subsp. lyrata]|uniref:Predicted protein n=1 Tax=Arabidopsis lyrata subsp. lyrata TaxID=81972 RepID=D7KFY5_ARALL|nr:predicted protein [Arabidopsis lyrata subsp. lyrata]
MVKAWYDPWLPLHPPRPPVKKTRVYKMLWSAIGSMKQKKIGMLKRHHWSAPEPGWIKCNFDGSFVNSGVPSEAGWILRDQNGTYIGSSQEIGRNTETTLESELQELLIAMQHCWCKGYKQTCFEGDN